MKIACLNLPNLPAHARFCLFITAIEHVSRYF